MSQFSRSVRRMSRYQLLVAITLSAASVAISIGIATGSPTASNKSENSVTGFAPSTVIQVPASATASLRAASLQLAAANGDSAPSSITAAMTDRQTAVGVVTPGDSVVTDESVYVVVMSGSFVGNDAKMPSNSALPSGATLAADFNPITLQVEDWSISSQPLAAQLSQLGNVTSLTGP